MKFLACFKIVPDLDMMPQGDWPVGESLSVDVRHVRTLWNCFDEGVLEMLLKLKDKAPATELNALTIGCAGCDPYLKTLSALGYENAARVEYGSDLRFVPELVARFVAAYAKKAGGFDVLIMGGQTSEGNNGKTPMLAAEYLGLPCISQVFAVDVLDESRLSVRSMTDQGEVLQTVSTPCVLSAGNIADSWLRVPTLKDRMQLGKKAVHVCTLDDLGLDEAACAEDVCAELSDLRRTVPKRLGVLLAEGSPEERARQLYDGFLRERLAKV